MNNAKNMKYIRPALPGDCVRIAETEIFCYRLNFYPIFRNDDFYFDELNVPAKAEGYRENIDNIFVYDEGVVKGFIYIDGERVRKLFVEPVLQNNGIGTALMKFAVENYGVKHLWVLEKNTRAITFYERHGFHLTEEKVYEEGTTEFLVKMERQNN